MRLSNSDRPLPRRRQSSSQRGIARGMVGAGGDDIARSLTSIVILSDGLLGALTHAANRSAEDAVDPRSEVWQSKLAALPLASLRRRRDRADRGHENRAAFDSQKRCGQCHQERDGDRRGGGPGAVFGELSALLDQPHTADVRTLKTSELHVADAATLLQDPAALLYVTMVLARRVEGANQGLLELKSQLAAGEPPGLIDATLDKIEGLLSAIGTGYIRAGAGASGYPFV